jgi:hypothetical protein
LFSLLIIQSAKFIKNQTVLNKINIRQQLEINNTNSAKENWKQFTLLIIVNAFVGGMIGMEGHHSKFAEIEFGVASKTFCLL